MGYKHNGEYFWPVNVLMDASHFRGNMQPLDRIGFCLLKMSDNLDLIQIEKFKNSVSVSDDQCLQYVRKQGVSSEDIIFTVHIGYDCLRCLCMEQSENACYKSHVAAMSSFFWVCCKERQK